MVLYKSLVGCLGLLYFLCSVATAAPVLEDLNQSDMFFNETGLEKRAAGDTEAEPIEATFDPYAGDKGGWPNIAEENCYAMLCMLGGQRVYQRAFSKKERKDHLEESGAKQSPFQSQNLRTFGTDRIDDTTNSPEEFPWRSIHTGGAGAYLFPATPKEQLSQGAGIKNGYTAAGVNEKDWFRITFKQPWGKYCSALFREPPDFSVCPQKEPQTLFGKTGVVIANFCFQWIKSTNTWVRGRPQSRGSGSKRSEDVEIFNREIDDDADDTY